MGKELNTGQIAQSTQEIGILEKLMAKAFLIMQMAIFMKENFRMIKLMALENIFIKMEVFIQENGRMIRNMDLGKKNGKMDHITKETSLTGLSTVKAFINGLIVLNLTVTGQTI